MARTLSLLSRHAPLASAAAQHARLGQLTLAREFHEAARSAGDWPLTPRTPATLQINVGKLCNQTCRHCHVDAGPDRREIMSRETMAQCLAALASDRHPDRRHHRRRARAQPRLPLARRAGAARSAVT